MPGRHREPLLDFGLDLGLDHVRETDVRDPGDIRTGEITGGNPLSAVQRQVVPVFCGFLLQGKIQYRKGEACFLLGDVGVGCIRNPSSLRISTGTDYALCDLLHALLPHQSDISPRYQQSVDLTQSVSNQSPAGSECVPS
jgi:hypothetical protein